MVVTCSGSAMMAELCGLLSQANCTAKHGMPGNANDSEKLAVPNSCTRGVGSPSSRAQYRPSPFATLGLLAAVGVLGVVGGIGAILLGIFTP